MLDMNFSTSEFLNYLVTNYTSRFLYIYWGGNSPATRSSRYISASVAGTGSGAANLSSAIEFTRYSAAASFPACSSNAKRLNRENKFKDVTTGFILARYYVPFSISEVIVAIGCLVQLVECHVSLSVLVLPSRESTLDLILISL